MAVFDLINPKWADEKSIIVVCDCGLAEHQVSFSYLFGVLETDEPGMLWMEFHLTRDADFFQRVWRSIRYIFGHRCRYGDWDTVELSASDAEVVADFLSKFVDDEKKRKVRSGHRRT